VIIKTKAKTEKNNNFMIEHDFTCELFDSLLFFNRCVFNKIKKII